VARGRPIGRAIEPVAAIRIGIPGKAGTVIGEQDPEPIAPAKESDVNRRSGRMFGRVPEEVR
jgi:hypothetical protein